MSDDQIKYMVERFLQWQLPEDFNPDAGISFNKTSKPVGTNLFDYIQATQMVRHMVDGMPLYSDAERINDLEHKLAAAHNIIGKLRKLLNMNTDEYRELRLDDKKENEDAT